MTPFLDILPFRFLEPERKEAVTRALDVRRFAAGDVLYRRGDTDDRVFLLGEGRVEVLHPKTDDRRVAVIEAGHYFGERSCLFEEGRTATVRALTEVTVGVLPGERFLQMVRTSPSFARALSFMLRDKQGVFVPFEKFTAELQQGISKGHILLHRLVPLYRELAPALHRGAAAEEVDWDALAYIVKRLPENVTRTFFWFLTGDLPYLYRDAARAFPAMINEARRRTVYEMMPGKSLVLVRDVQSDVVDFVTCLCTFAVEARKIRRRLRDPDLLCRLARNEPDIALPFSEAEQQRLEALWPGEVVRRLAEIAIHHEDVSVSLWQQLDNYNSDLQDRWIRQIGTAARELLGDDVHALPDDFAVHLISSNTHSVPNCLSEWLPAAQEAILSWGAVHRPDLCADTWHEPQDLAVALLRDYLAANPEAAAEKAAIEGRGGVVRLRETAFTGIEVQLIDTRRLPRPAKPALIVNIDFAFGAQAEPIVANLISLFGRRVRSVNVLGKAGGLSGVRGEVLAATGFVDQREDELKVTPCDVDLAALRRRLPDRVVREGRLLTVAGTLLQNDRMLHFYRHLWGCIGLEMEGSYYARQVLEAKALGRLDEDCAVRCVYYVSDTPLVHDATLSVSMRPAEGIPPLYAITRQILAEILGS